LSVTERADQPRPQAPPRSSSGLPRSPSPRDRAPWAARGTLCALALVGLLAAVAVESLAAAQQSGPERKLLGGWLSDTIAPAHLLRLPSTATVVVGAASLLVLAWLCIAVYLIRTQVHPAVTLVIAGLWSAPFLMGVPILSRDCYAYLAQGEVMRRGWDPYAQSVARLGAHDGLAAAVDPLWRTSVPPYGPVGLRLSELAAWIGHALGHPQIGLLVLRGLAVSGIGLAVVCICVLAPAHRRSAAIWLMMSPLTLLQLIGAAHMEGVLAGLLAAAVLALRRDRTVAATACIVVASCIKITAFGALAVVLIHCWQHTARGRRARKALQLTGAALLALAAAMVAAGGSDAWGWLHGLTTPGSVWDPLTPANEVLLAARHIVALSRLPVPAGLGSIIRTVVVAVGVAAAVAIIRGAPRREPCLTGAYLLADLALCGPTLWPWYLAPVIVLLLASQATRGWLYAAALGASGALWVLPLRVVQMQRVAFAAEACTVVAVACWLLWQRQRADVWHPAAQRREVAASGAVQEAP
jgi:hypothetical protein